jgi:hypothetical protein
MTLRRIALLSLFSLMTPVLAGQQIVSPPEDIRNESWVTENFVCRVSGKVVTQSESQKQLGLMMSVIALSVDGTLVSYIEELSGFPQRAYLKTQKGWVLFNAITTENVGEYKEALPAALGLAASQWDECSRSFVKN